MKLHNPLPESIGINCGKAASILEHFIKGTNQMDNSLIPTRVLNTAAGIAIITVVKAGFLWSGRAGTGIVVAKLPDGSWSAPSGICLGGMGLGAQLGCQITDIVLILNTPMAVRAFSHGNVTLGGNISVAAGPTGRSSEVGGTILNPAPIYSYSKSKGIFAGITIEGTVILTRTKANRAMYGKNVKSSDLLEGRIQPPPVAAPLYRMLDSRFGSFKASKIDNVGDFGNSNGTLHDSPQYQDFDNRNSVSILPNEHKTQSKTTRKGPPVVAPKPQRVRALYDFNGEQQGDLRFKEGDVILVSSRNGEWFEGTMNGVRGSFPANYVSNL